MQPLPHPNILTEVRLEGFKAHKDSTFPLAPFTLVLGSNSAGKSSLFHALLALKQSLDRGPNRFTDLLTDGPKARLGRFGNLQWGHNPQQDITIGLRDAAETSLRLCYRNRFPDEQLTDGFLPSENILREVELGSRGGHAPIHLRDWSAEAAAGNLGEIRTARCTFEAAEGVLTVAHREAYRSVDLFARAETDAASPSQAGAAALLRRVLPDRSARDRDSLEHRRQALTQLIDRSLFDPMVRVRRLLHVGPLRAQGERSYDLDIDAPTDAGSAGQHLASLLVRGDYLDRVNEALLRLDLGLKLELLELPTRGTSIEVRLKPTRSDAAPSVGIQDVGFGVSQVLPILLQYAIASSAFDAAVQYAESTSVGDAETAVADIERQLVLIEQPELHLHPRLTVDLMRLLADAHGRRDPSGGPPARFQPKAQFLIETHSETIVEAVQQLVRLGYLAPSDVSILSVERGTSGASEVRRIQLNSRGEFLDRWPRGFFAEHSDLAWNEDIVAPEGL
jgi:hypothetical protein